MSGIDFRGRRRFRDSEATERLSALLRENGAGGTSQAVPGHQDDEDLSGGSGSLQAEVSSGESMGGGEDSLGPVPGRRHVGPSTGPDHEKPGDTGAWQEPAGSRHREDVVVRRRLSRPALVLLCVVLLIALGVGCTSLLVGGAQDDAVVTTASSEAETAQDGTRDAGTVSRAPSRGADGPGTGTGRGTGTAGSTAGTDGGVVTVHVVGEVKDPSVIILSPGARVMDAVQAAGGFTPGAVKDRINLAEPVVDGAQIVIPNRSNVDEVLAAGAAPGAGARSAGPAPGGSAAGGTSPGGSAGAGAPGQGGSATERTSGTGDQRAPGAGSGALVNLNTASQAELEELPKVGPVLAQRIVEFRTQHGAFTSPEQLDDVSGVGPAMLESLLPLVTV